MRDLYAYVLKATVILILGKVCTRERKRLSDIFMHVQSERKQPDTILRERTKGSRLPWKYHTPMLRKSVLVLGTLMIFNTRIGAGVDIDFSDEDENHLDHLGVVPSPEFSPVESDSDDTTTTEFQFEFDLEACLDYQKAKDNVFLEKLPTTRYFRYLTQVLRTQRGGGEEIWAVRLALFHRLRPTHFPMTSFPPNLKGFIAVNVQLLGLLDEHCLDLLRELEQGSQNGQTEVADADETLQQPQAYPLAGVVSLCILMGLSELPRASGDMVSKESHLKGAKSVPGSRQKLR